MTTLTGLMLSGAARLGFFMGREPGSSKGPRRVGTGLGWSLRAGRECFFLPRYGRLGLLSREAA